MARIELVKPDCEITISTKGCSNTALVAGLFVEEDGTTDVAIGWDGETDLSGLRALLEAVALALSTSINWVGSEDVRSASEQSKAMGDELPF